jgi:hypothetical protein
VIEFVFMLTRDDVTVGDAADVLASLRESGLRYVGFKDIGPPPETLAEVTRAAHEASMEVMLEVVSTSAEHELRSLRAALAIGVDWVLGGTHAREGVEILGGAVKYCPFPGTIVGHPSVLEGTHDEIVAHALELASHDRVWGLDLLAYRFSGDADALMRETVAAVEKPVIVAGSVADGDRIAKIAAAGAWGFTVGSAAFDGRFVPGAPLIDQLHAVLDAAHATPEEV